MRLRPKIIKDWMSLDRSTGNVFIGESRKVTYNWTDAGRLVDTYDSVKCFDGLIFLRGIGSKFI